MRGNIVAMQQARSTNLSLHNILSAIKANDEAVIRQLYADNYPAIAQFVSKNNGSSDDAQDIYQEAFLTLWRNIQLNKFQAGESSSISAYLYQVARNKWIDQLRARKTKPMVALVDERMAEIPEDGVSQDTHQYLDAVKNGFSSLGSKCRDLLNRFYYRKQSLREIASELNWTEPTAKNNKYRCLQELRTLVKTKVQK